MPKTRLNQTSRETLTKFAKHQVDILLSAERAAMEGAQRILREITEETMRETFVSADLDVLERFDRVEYVDSVSVNIGEFNYRPDFSVSVSTIRWPKVDRKFTRLILPEDHPVVVAWNAAHAAKQGYGNLCAAKLLPYRTLVTGSRTFEDVAEVWPGAEELRASICGPGTSLAVLSESAKAAIAADSEALRGTATRGTATWTLASDA